MTCFGVVKIASEGWKHSLGRTFVSAQFDLKHRILMCLLTWKSENALNIVNWRSSQGSGMTRTVITD